MRTTSTPILQKAIIFALLSLFTITLSQAQDLSAGVKAPANVKADGKLIEWNTPLLYNKSTMLHYTVANDDQNIYMAITSTDQPTINKILANGMTIVLNKDGKKRDKDALVLMYPVPNRAGGRGGFGGRPGGAGGGNRGGGAGGAGGNRQGNQAKPDTLALIAAHKRSITAAKEFRITGVKSIADTTNSIYNTYGIKTVINFDAKANLVYEIAIPLSLMDLSATQQTELAFNIKVNGIDFNGGNMIEGAVVTDVVRGGGGGGPIRISGGSGGIDMFSATDFWGKYKLIK